MNYYCGIDLGCKETAMCVIDDNRKVIREVKIPTEEADIKKVLKGLKGVSCLVETAPLAEWLANVVESGGHKVSLVCAKKAKRAMVSHKKTDQRDALALSELCRSGWYEPVHRKSGAARNMRSFMIARKQLVESSCAIASSIRGILRAHGIRVGAVGSDEPSFAKTVKVVAARLDKQVKDAILELLKAFEQLHDQQRKMYRQLEKETRAEGPAKLLKTAHGVGAATATAFVATIDDPYRFADGEKLASYLGLVPSIYQSGGTEYRGRITKTGDKLLRWLLVEAANSLLVRTKKESALREWGLRLKETKGCGKARVAIARRLCGILLKMWKENQEFNVGSVKAAA